ncbi:MAG: hypothetical protein AB7V26_07265 [Lysobacterales bacterium]
MWHKLLLGLGLFAIASVSEAGFSFDKTLSINDGQGGQFVSHSTGEVGADAGNTVSNGTFSQFHPRAESSASINGTLDRQAVRDGEVRDVSYDGNLVLSGDASTGTATTLTLLFDDLVVHHDPDGVVLTGTVNVNGRDVPAASLPRPIRATLVRLVGLFRL